MEGPIRVDRHHAPPGRVVDVWRDVDRLAADERVGDALLRRRIVNPGGVHDDVEATVLRHRVIDERVDLTGVGDVDGRRTDAFQPRRGRLRGRLVEVSGHDRGGTLGGEPPDDGGADARAGSGDERDLAGEAHRDQPSTKPIAGVRATM
jgi:hypothetical protein